VLALASFVEASADAPLSIGRSLGAPSTVPAGELGKPDGGELEWLGANLSTRRSAVGSGFGMS
jgi:hypothetical protein